MKKYAVGSKNRNWTRVWTTLAVVFVVTLVASAYLVRKSYYANLEPLNDVQKSQLITIEPGETVQQISDKLEKNELIKASWAFEWYIRNSDFREKLQAGTYALRPSLSVQEIAKILTQGKIATELVTIFPGQRIEDVRDSLINQGLNVDEVDSALNPAKYANHPALVDKPAEANLEGYLFPESFQRNASTETETIITLALNELQNRLTPEVRAGIVKQGLTVHQAVILASIVGQEVSDPVEQKSVAQVFLKRLRQGMALGADATTRYALNKPKGPLTAEDLASDSPYNTRKFKGLPPGPISNFKASALEAVAFPADGEYLFFVTGRDFVTRFSKTADEHQALIDKHGVGGEE